MWKEENSFTFIWKTFKKNELKPSASYKILFFSVSMISNIITSKRLSSKSNLYGLRFAIGAA